MRPGLILVGAGLILVLIVLLFQVPGTLTQSGSSPTVMLVYASSGIMPQLLNTSQIDACIVWESVVSTTTLGDIGKVAAREKDIPPDHKWKDSACNVLVMRDDFINQYPEIASLLSAVTIAGMREIKKDPDSAKEITATWVYGAKPIRSADISLNPHDVENESFPHITFTDTAPLPDIASTTPGMNGEDTVHADSMTNESVKTRAMELLSGAKVRTGTEPPLVRVGYLPSSDLYAPLYVTIKRSQQICDEYGFCLVPDPGEQGRPENCELKVQNDTAAYVRLFPGSVGGGLMTALGQNALDAAYIGSVPVMLQISMGNHASVIQSINAGGTGLLVDDAAPVTDWDSFVAWIRKRSAEGRPVILAAPQSSIQEEMIREAFEYEGIHISLYGLSPMEIR